MRFRVAKQDLEAALQVVGTSIASSGSDISAHYTFRRTGTDGKYGVEILTYAGQTWSSCPVHAVSFMDSGEKKKTSFTVEGWRLNDWLKAIPGDSVPEFSLLDGEVNVKVRRGSQDFQSLDPATFPYWDKTLGEATVKATVPADRLAAALSHARLFILDKSTTEPEKSVCEVREGVLYSTNNRAASWIRIPGMEDSSLRVHGKDVGGLLSFLATAASGDVEILEHPRNTFVRRCFDGAIFGEALFQFAFRFPSGKMDDPPHHTWRIPCDEFRSAVQFLVSGAAPEDNRLHLVSGDLPGEVILSMANTTKKTTSLPLSGVEMQSDPKAPAMPEDGFSLDHNILDKVLGVWKDPVVEVGISFKGNRGLLRFRHEKLSCVYVTVLGTLA